MDNNQGIVKNKEELCSGGNVRLRRDVISIVESGIEKVIPYQSAKRMVRLEQNILWVEDESYDLLGVENIYIVGAGKASFPIAKALDEVLGDRITAGIVAVKDGTNERLSHVDIIESSHPIPDERSVVAARRICGLLERAKKNDMVFAIVTGGASSLVNMTPDGIGIDAVQKLNDDLLKCGGTIVEINTVRRHLCLLKGGNTVRRAQPARIITLTLDTGAPGVPWPDMCLPDPSTFQDAIDVLHFYELWEETAASIREYLLKGCADPSMETVKTFAGMNQSIHYLAKPATACAAAAQKAMELGYVPHILSSAIEGEAKDVGIVLAGVSNEIGKTGQPFSAPCALISGGETTVTVYDKKNLGVGGPNQETALGFAMKISPDISSAFACVDTDGTDGPCDLAGGLVDNLTAKQAKERGFSIKKYLLGHDAGSLLLKLGSAVITGNTGTNVMNLRVVLLNGQAGFEK